MWIAHSDGWLSIVAHRTQPDDLLVRARHPEHIQALFPEVEVTFNPDADYHYRVVIPREEVQSVISNYLANMQYDNFKNSIEDFGFHEACTEVWGVMHDFGSEYGIEDLSFRTSESDPIYVKWVQIEGDEGCIGITLCPGKFQLNARSGNWDRQLSIDLSDLVENEKADRLVSLITEEEIEDLQVEDLPQEAADQGLKWDHLPFEDGTAPDGSWLESAEAVFQSLLTSIPSGERVVVHCMGGLSRAGTIVAIYLWRRGYSMIEAIERVRTERSRNAINAVQERFLYELAEGGQKNVHS